MLHRTVIEVLLYTEDGPDATAIALDAVAEALRPMLKTYADIPTDTAWVDWQYVEPPRPYAGGSDFEFEGGWLTTEK